MKKVFKNKKEMYFAKFGGKSVLETTIFGGKSVYRIIREKCRGEIMLALKIITLLFLLLFFIWKTTGLSPMVFGLH